MKIANCNRLLQAYELSDIYSLPIIKILNQDLSKDKTVYDGTQVIAYFTPKPNGKSFISIDLEGMKTEWLRIG